MTHKSQSFFLMFALSSNLLIVTAETPPSHVSASPSRHSPEPRTHSSDLDSGSVNFYRPESIPTSDSEAAVLKRENAFLRSKTPPRHARSPHAAQPTLPNIEQELFKSESPEQPLTLEAEISDKIQTLKNHANINFLEMCMIVGLSPKKLEEEASKRFYNEKHIKCGKIQRKLIKYGVRTHLEITLADHNIPEMPNVLLQINPYGINVLPSFFKLSDIEQRSSLKEAAWRLKTNQFGIEAIIAESIQTLQENPLQQKKLLEIQDSSNQSARKLAVLKMLRKATRANNAQTIEELTEMLSDNDKDELNIPENTPPAQRAQLSGHKRNRE